MAGRPARRADAFIELVQARREREEIGLDPLPCGTILGSGRRMGLPCDNAPLPNHIRCHAHRYDVPSKKNAEAIAKEAREEMAIHLLPKSMIVVDDILSRETIIETDLDTGLPIVVQEAAQDKDKLRAAQLVMDRVGLVPGADLRMSVDVRVEPPLELLARAMAGIAERMGLSEPAPPHDVIDVEAIEGPQSDEQPATGAGPHHGGSDV